MYIIQQDFTNQFGINIKGFGVVIRNISIQKNTTINIANSTEVTRNTNSSINVSYSAEAFPSELAYTSGAQGMPVYPANQMGGFYFSPTEEILEGTEVDVCIANMLSQMFPESAVAAVPFSVTRRQARQQLSALGLLDQVEAVITAIEDPAVQSTVRIFWEDSTAFERNNSQLIMLGTSLGLDAAALDAAFIAAAKL